MKTFISAIALLFFISFSQAQETPKYFNKVQTLDSTIETLYSVISGEKGEERDWALFQYLFTENAKLIPTGMNQEKSFNVNYWSPEEYIEKAGVYLQANGFFEKEIHREVQTFGSLTHVFSTYESYNSQNEETPFARGINSIQLLYDNYRWWIVNIYWVGESEANPIPKQYLPTN
ncbi:hypothetical protein [Luteirhabdus pelagi]|uniref:hypothetical protein n=1 Tax=Luteirhabdus pelagi TaxID=2792783 RepID=UPI00193AC185|nr:hypothetical protein [Luteirhabdus pelagi]